MIQTYQKDSKGAVEPCRYREPHEPQLAGNFRPVQTTSCKVTMPHRKRLYGLNMCYGIRLIVYTADLLIEGTETVAKI